MVIQWVIQVCQVGSGVYRSKNEGKDLVATWVFQTKETRREFTRIHELTTCHKEAVQIWMFNWLSKFEKYYIDYQKWEEHCLKSCHFVTWKLVLLPSTRWILRRIRSQTFEPPTLVSSSQITHRWWLQSRSQDINSYHRKRPWQKSVLNSHMASNRDFT